MESKFKKGDTVRVVRESFNGDEDGMVRGFSIGDTFVIDLIEESSHSNVKHWFSDKDKNYVAETLCEIVEKKDGFSTKDSGERKSFDSGMVRDTNSGKARYDLVYLPMFKRWAELMARGAEKYGERNWEKASGEAELARFQESAFRHFCQWISGETDEDHGAAVFFNISGAEMVRAKLNG